MRRLLAALLDADVSIRDLEEFAQTFETGTASLELSNLIRQTIVSLNLYGTEELSYSRGPTSEQIALSRIQQRRMSKETLLQLMDEASGFAFKPTNHKASVRDIVGDFFRLASKSDTDRFLKLIERPTPDPFLKGITNRR